MNKKDLVVILAEETGLTQEKSAEVLDCVFQTILQKALQGDSYHHRGFGKFILLSRRQRVIHNVALRKLTTVAKKKILRFIPSRRLLQKINLKTKTGDK